MQCNGTFVSCSFRCSFSFVAFVLESVRVQLASASSGLCGLQHWGCCLTGALVRGSRLDHVHGAEARGLEHLGLHTHTGSGRNSNTCSARGGLGWCVLTQQACLACCPLPCPSQPARLAPQALHPYCQPPLARADSALLALTWNINTGGTLMQVYSGLPWNRSSTSCECGGKQDRWVGEKRSPPRLGRRVRGVGRGMARAARQAGRLRKQPA